MLNPYELEQLVAFAELGTLAKVSEQFHISTPTITRSMQHLEDAFGVPLFIRSKNRIELNETGKKAVEAARNILREQNNALKMVRDFDRSLNTITVSSCAPAPLWTILPKLSKLYPGRIISSDICDNDAVKDSWVKGRCDIAVLPYKVGSAVPYMTENLFVCVKKDHELATRSSVTFSDLNGYNFLLRSELGFWDTLCRNKMPASRFLVQTDDFEFNELVRSSSLPCFVTDIVLKNGSNYENRVYIPITDEEANITFHILSNGKYPL